MRYMIDVLSAGIAIGLIAILIAGPPLADRLFNRSSSVAYPISERAARLHDRLLVVDLHADFLLWKRDLLKRYERGHVDLPRLREGNVALQTFSVVTKSPWGQNYQRTSANSDRITLLAIAQLWPVRTWTSLRERALYQAERLHVAVGRSKGRLVLIRTSSDLQTFIEQRRAGRDVTAGLLAMEGLHALEGDLENVDVLYEAGYRMMAPVHMFDNEVAGSAQGVEQGGLTDFGYQVIRRMEELHILVDLAHASPQTIDEVLEVTSGPVVISHTGIRATCDSPRNLGDDQIRRIAATGGVIGIGFWEGAVCGAEVRDIVRAIRHVSDLVGDHHVALGSDFDGTVHTPFDASGMAALTEELLKDGFSNEQIKRIMGANAIRLFERSLPRE